MLNDIMFLRFHFPFISIFVSYMNEVEHLFICIKAFEFFSANSVYVSISLEALHILGILLTLYFILNIFPSLPLTFHFSYGF